jgi:hypothetical protein
MKSFAEKLREDRRLVILRLLSEQPQFRMNSSNVYLGLNHLGVLGTRDDVLTDLHWLKDQGLLRLDDVPEVPSLMLCTLTARGQDVSTGSARVPGVSVPHAR